MDCNNEDELCNIKTETNPLAHLEIKTEDDGDVHIKAEPQEYFYQESQIQDVSKVWGNNASVPLKLEHTELKSEEEDVTTCNEDVMKIQDVGLNSTNEDCLLSEKDQHTSLPLSENNTVSAMPVVTDARNNFEEKAGEKNYKCNVCEKSFSRNYYLKCHMKIHCKVKPYPCNFCEKSFVRNYALKNHIGVHYKVKPYPCTLCDKSFARKSCLDRHFLLHSDESYDCFKCESSFNSRYYLTIHMKEHDLERKYLCNICGKSFGLKMSLDAHLRIHAGIKVFECDHCERSFSIKAQWYKHTISHSKEQPNDEK